MSVVGVAPLCSTTSSELWSPGRGVERAIIREATHLSAVTLWYTGTRTYARIEQLWEKASIRYFLKRIDQHLNWTFNT